MINSITFWFCMFYIVGTIGAALIIFSLRSTELREGLATEEELGIFLLLRFVSLFLLVVMGSIACLLRTSSWFWQISFTFPALMVFLSLFSRYILGYKPYEVMEVTEIPQPSVTPTTVVPVLRPKEVMLPEAQAA